MEEKKGEVFGALNWIFITHLARGAYPFDRSLFDAVIGEK